MKQPTDNQWHSLLAGFRKPFCDLQWIFPLYSGVHYPQMIAISVHDYSGVQASLWLLQWTSIFSQSSVMLLYPTTLSPTTESWDHPRNLSDYTDIHYRALVRGPQWTCLTVLTPQLLSKHSKSQWLPGYFQSVTDLPVTATEIYWQSLWTSKELALACSELTDNVNPRWSLLTSSELWKMTVS